MVIGLTTWGICTMGCQVPNLKPNFNSDCPHCFSACLICVDLVPFHGHHFLIQNFPLASQLFTFSHFAERDHFPENHIPQPNCTCSCPYTLENERLEAKNHPFTKKTWSSKPQLLNDYVPCEFSGVYIPIFYRPVLCFSFFFRQEMVHLISSTWSLGERWLGGDHK